jgi:hypothetical protein
MSALELTEAGWRRSTYCGSTSCVEIAFTADGGVAMRDSKAPEQPAKVYSADEWQQFVAGVRDGEFDLAPR